MAADPPGDRNSEGCLHRLVDMRKMANQRVGAGGRIEGAGGGVGGGGGVCDLQTTSLR